MAYYDSSALGDIGAIAVGGGARKIRPAPVANVLRQGAGGAMVVGGVPKMSAVRRTMNAQGLRAEGHITKRPAPPPKRGGFQPGRGGARPIPRGGFVPQVPLVPAAPLIEVMPPGPPEVLMDTNGVNIGDYGVSTRRLSHSRMLRGSYGSAPLIYGIGDGMGDDDGLGGFSLKGIVKGVSKAVKKVASPIQKGAAAVGHEAGKVVTSKAGQAILGTALAATGVGIPAAAAIMGGTKAVGNLIKPGGNIKHAATGLFQGAAEGVVAGAAGAAFKAVAPNAQQSVSSGIKNLESKFVQGAKTVGKGIGKGAKAVEHGAETVVKDVVKGTGKVLGGIGHGAAAVGKAVIGIPGSFIPTHRDPNGDGINEDTGLPSDEASSAEDAGRAVRGSRLPRDQRPQVGRPGSFPRSPRDPLGTGIDQSTGGYTPEAQGGIDRGIVDQTPYTPSPFDTTGGAGPQMPTYQAPFGGSSGAGGAPMSSGGDLTSLAAGGALAAGAGAGVDEAGIMGAGAGAGAGGLGGLLGNINPTMVLAGAAAFVLLPKLMGGGGGKSRSSSTRRRSSSRSRSRRR